MMKNYFNPKDRLDLLNRLEQVTSQSVRKWGTMDATEMLLHLRCQIELALGVIPPGKSIESSFSFPPVRWLALYIIKWPKGSPTAPEMNVKKGQMKTVGFATEKELLLERLSEIEQCKRMNAHPLFGNMDRKQWGRVIWKHIDHHLRQFGC